MKKYNVIGTHIKSLRMLRERNATQKEFAHEIRVSERKLRDIECNKCQVEATLLDRIAKALSVHREQLIFQNTKDNTTPVGLEIFDEDEWIVDRFDTDIAHVTMDEGILYREACNSEELCFHIINLSLNEEILNYADELNNILKSLVWKERGILNSVDASLELSKRKRIRQLLVLLRGNDVWVYVTSNFKRLPEMFSLPDDDAASRTEIQLVVGLSLPGEYGETSIHVPIDHGQPFKLKPFGLRIANRATS